MKRTSSFKSVFLIAISLVIAAFSAFLVLAESSRSSTTTPFGGIGLIVTCIMIYQLSKSEKIAVEESDGKRIGIAGWLLFFIGLMVVSASIVLIRIISDFIQMALFYPSGLLSGIFLVFELLDVIVGIATLYAAYCLWKVRPQARKIAIGVLLFEILTVAIYVLTPGTDELSSALSFIGVFWDVVMIIYFATSARVRATYAKDAKLPKKRASSNKTVMGWIVAQAIVSIMVFAMFQFMYFSENIETSKDKPCVEYCTQNFETFDSYYYGYDEETGAMLCQCLKSDELMSYTSFPVTK